VLKLSQAKKLATPAVLYGWAPWLLVLAVYMTLLATVSPWK
jgi:hypothetical protein